MRLELRGVTKAFGRFQALRGVDLVIESGSRVALIGPNGSGKSTLTRVLLGMLSYRGNALLDGVEASARARAASGSVAYIPQAPPQFRVPLNELVDAMCTLRGLTPEQVAEPARRLGLDLEALGGKEFRGLSGGMKQKVLIAMAAATRAPLLVMDEPTSSLDAPSRDRFFELCAELPSTSTLILCSHRLEEIRSLVDHVVVLDEGRVGYQGSAADFLASRSRCAIEIACPSGAGADWLAQRGFHAGADGRWRTTVAHELKRELVLSAARELGADLEDLQIRDLERLELDESGGGQER